MVAQLPHHMWMVVLGTFAWIFGLIFSRSFYGKVGEEDPMSSRYPSFFELCRSKLFFDEIYDFYLKKVQNPLANFFEVMELLFVSGLMVRGAAECLLCSLCWLKHAMSERFTLIPFGLFWERLPSLRMQLG